MGFEDPALRAIEQCPAAASLVGTPVRRSWLGLSCGNAETADDNGYADWQFPVSGPQGRGSVSVVAEEHGGTWQLISGSLEAAGRTIDIVQCIEGEAVPVTPTSFAANVTSVIGTPGVAQGASCRISVNPGDGPYPCRVEVACGETTLYGSGSGGYAACGRGPDGALRVRDGSPSSQGGDPTLDLQLGAGTAVLTDEAGSGTWVVQLTFTPQR